MKNIIIGGIATVIVVAGSTILLSGQNPGHADNLETLLQDYQKVAEEMKSSKTKSSLSNNCKSTKAFTKKIERLENKLKKLNTRKNEIINQQKVVPPLPDIDPENIQMIQDNTTPRPGSEAPELSSDVPPLPDIDPENIQMIPDNTTPRPGSEIPELSSDVPPLPDIDPENIQMIPDNTTLLDKINELEKEIIKELNSLKSLCDDEGEDIISNSCDAACKKYSECTHYTEDTTAQDRKDAYDSCMIECAKWSDKTKICINKKPIKTVMDCANLSICALSEYSNAVEGIKK